MSNACIYFLNDCIKELIEEAKKIKSENDYESGILMGYYRSISHLLVQAEGFQIMDQLDSEIQSFDPLDLFRKQT